MAFFRRLHCHFCGARSAHGKSSGVREFQCASCEAVNFLDEHGSIVDTPASVVVRQQQQHTAPIPTVTRPLPDTLEHQQKPAFCSACTRNQRFYLETLSNYLPDEDHPDYNKFEAALPKFKRELEARYPQVCTKCAPQAQAKINRADYFAGTQNMERLARATQARRLGGTADRREDWWKRSMRLLLSLLEVVVYGSLLAQIAWHMYSVLNTVTNKNVADQAGDVALAFEPTLQDCARLSLSMRFEDTCLQIFGMLMLRSLAASILLIWLNPGLKAWYHPFHRIQAVTGQAEHFYLQVILLVARAVAYFKLSDLGVTESLTAQQLLASHGFSIALMLIIQWISIRTIKTVPWKLNLKMTPRPRELDVFGVSAGQDAEDYEHQPSSLPPTKLFARDRTAPFPIWGLAPRQSQASSSMNASPGAAPPSPPESTSDIDDADVMEIDYPVSLQSQMPGAKIDRTYRPRYVEVPKHNARSTWNHSTTQPTGWGALRDETFRIQADADAEAERKRREVEERAKLQYKPPVELSPFRGRLPQAPMSMGKRLRNPPTQVSFKKVEASKQQDFLKQMREGIEGGKTFASQGYNEGPAAKKQYAQRFGNILGSEDENDSPAKIRRPPGTLELRESTWKLPSDLQPSATGLEDLLGGDSFKISDEATLPQLSPVKVSDRAKLWRWVFGLVLPVAVVVAACTVKEARRTICLWLVARLESIGY